MTWFDGGELAGLQLSCEKSPKGREAKEHYANYADLDAAERAECGRALPDASPGAPDAVCQGVLAGLVQVARDLWRHYRKAARGLRARRPLPPRPFLSVHVHLGPEQRSCRRGTSEGCGKNA